jgi:GDP-mannose 6-dehydrogenase
LNISPAYLRPGFAFGGSCLPKDLRSLTVKARRLGAELPILEAVLPSNRLQIEEARCKILALGGRRVAVLGLSFKLGTDDLRESPVIDLIRALLRDGMDVLVYDPDVQPDEMLGSNREYLERQLPQITQILWPKLQEVLDTCQVIVVSQNRPEFAAALEGLKGHVAILDLVGLSEKSCSLRVSTHRSQAERRPACSKQGEDV